MKRYNIYEAKTNLSKIAKMLENKEEDYVIISKNDKPLLKVTLFEGTGRENLLGCAKGMFTVPDDFDDIDISDLFEDDLDEYL